MLSTENCESVLLVLDIELVLAKFEESVAVKLSESESWLVDWLLLTSEIDSFTISVWVTWLSSTTGSTNSWDGRLSGAISENGVDWGVITSGSVAGCSSIISCASSDFTWGLSSWIDLSGLIYCINSSMLVLLAGSKLIGSTIVGSSSGTSKISGCTSLVGVNVYVGAWVIGSSALTTGASFKLQSAETISSRYFFTRVKNQEYNYTTNPSIIDDQGNLLYSTLINNPQTYITTVGLYNDNNELLGVAKLSKPLTKDFTKEALIRIKLDY